MLNIILVRKRDNGSIVVSVINCDTFDISRRVDSIVTLIFIKDFLKRVILRLGLPS